MPLPVVAGLAKPREILPRHRVIRREPQRFHELGDRVGIASEQTKIIFRAGVDRRAVFRVLRFPVALHRPARQYFEAGQIRGFAVMFPANEARNRVTVFYPGAGEKPVALIHARPIRATGHSRALRTCFTLRG